jgi:glycosyltransferase involved in cell wall biosynthesis
MRYVLIGDGESPHLLKWARALTPCVQLFAVSSRGFTDDFPVPAQRRLALQTTPEFEGGNAHLLKSLPRVGRWLREQRPDVLHAHYLTSHGTLAWLAQRLYRLPGRLIGSAWGSDILVTPQRSRALYWVTRRVLSACALSTSDSQHMAARMRELGARDVMVFPFGLDAMPPQPAGKEDRLFFANRALEPIYAPQRVINTFAAIAGQWPDARLVIANNGSASEGLRTQAASLGLGDRVQFTGRLDAATQAQWYARARWFMSLPESDSVSVSVLEAMAHGCIPLLSDLPANHELVQDGRNGLIVRERFDPATLGRLLAEGDTIARDNRAWVHEHALFGPCVERFLARVSA